MAQTALDAQTTLPAVTEDAFTADRFKIWAAFCRFAMVGASIVGIIVILMALFLT